MTDADATPLDRAPRHPASIAEVIANGLCIGCGLCEALGPDRWRMRITADGRLRPASRGPVDASADAAILAACPGAVVEATPSPDATIDSIWGGCISLGEAWAGDPDLRFRAATGGALSALGAFLLRSGRARFILHCGADPDAPMRSRWVMSETPDEVIARSGSRYGPSDTLAGLEAALARAEPFAVIAKPCDAGALRARAKADPRIDQHLVAVLVMVCGGASDLGKSQAVLDEYGLTENDLTVFRYRGYGNPGRTRIETKDGRAFEKTYSEMWGDEAGWRIQTRCKLCPDAIGEAADIAAADIWPNADPSGEDAGFNGVITRTAVGQALFEAAVAAGDLVAGRPHSPRDYDSFQPHQVAKKRAMAARLRGLAAAGAPVYRHAGLRLDALDAADPDEEAGARRRTESGRFAERVPTDVDERHRPAQCEHSEGDAAMTENPFDKDLFETGLAQRKGTLGAEYVETSLANADDFTRPFQEAMTAWCWGFGWGDDAIDAKTRSIMNLAMIGALGKMTEWELHCRGALNNGVTKAEIRAIIHVIGIYCGVPQALECFRAAKKVLAEHEG